MTRRTATLLCIATFAAPLRAELADDIDALKVAWTANANVTVLPPRFVVAGEPLVVSLPLRATDTRTDGCTTVAILGAVSTTFAVHLAADDSESPQAESFLPSVAGAVHIVRCGPERNRLELIGVQMRSPHAVLETIVATSKRPLIELRSVLGHRDPGSVPSVPGPGPAPAPAPIDVRAQTVEHSFSREGAVDITPRLGPTDAAGAGQILLDLSPGCHHIAVMSTIRQGVEPTPDVDAEVAWASGQVAASDRTDSPDAMLMVCNGERRLGVLAYGGGPPKTPVLILEGKTDLPPGLPAGVGADALGRMAKALSEYHAVLPVTQPVYQSLGVAGLTELPVETEPGQCYVALVVPIQGEPKLLSFTVESGTVKSRSHTDDADAAVLLSFCAGATDRARFEVEAHGKEIVWLTALWPISRLRLGEEAP